MKNFLKWTFGIAAGVTGGVLAMQAVQAARRRAKQTLSDTEAVADQARATLEQTEVALRNVRNAI
jgi:hypothetical protein